MTTAEATHVGCTQCGGTIPVTDLVSDVTCPYCGNVQQLDPRWLDVALWYAASVERQVASLVRAREAAVAKSVPNRGELRHIGLVIVYVPFVIFGLIVTHLEDLLDGGVLLLGGLMFASATLIFPFVFAKKLGGKLEGRVRVLARQGVESTIQAPKTLVCPTCGAQQQLGSGHAIRACHHCGASLTATLSQMAWAGWELALHVRRRVAGLRTSPPLGSRTADRTWRWAWASGLAAALHGAEGLQHRARWFRGYWPEVVEAFVDHGSFVWGHRRGYPVAVHLFPSNSSGSARFEIHVAAICFPADRGSVWNGLRVTRTLSGYHVVGLQRERWASLEEIAWIIDHTCALAQHEGFPPAPYLEPVVDALPNPLRRT